MRRHQRSGAAMMVALVALALHASGCASDTIASSDPSNLGSTQVQMALSRSADTVLVDQRLRLTAIIPAGFNVVGGPVWSSSDSNVAVVTNDGMVFALKSGRVVVKAAIGNSVASTTLTVLPSIKFVRFEADTLALGLSQGVKLPYQAIDSDGNSVDLKNHSTQWISSSPDVAQVTDTGGVFGKTLGSTDVKLTVDGRASFIRVQVKPPTVASVTIRPSPLSLVAATQQQLSAVVTDAAGTPLPNRLVTWNSANPAVATISSTGMLTSVGVGTTKITAVCENKREFASVTVVASPDSIVAQTPSVAPERRAASVAVVLNPSALTVGQTTQASAVVKDSTGSVMTDRTVLWTSSDASIATVSASGLVSAMKAGSAVITAGADGVTANSVVVVSNPTLVPSSITITMPSQKLSVGQTEQVTAVVKDANGTIIPAAVVTWASSPSMVVNVTSNGVALGLSAGTGSLTASVSGISQSAGLTVVDSTTVTPPVSDAGACSAYSATRVVPVATVSQLANALSSAQPGDRIELADGTYASKFSISTSGTAAAPIVLCGSRRAVLAQGVLSSGNGIYLKGSYWTFAGFSITNSQVGVAIVGGNNNVIDGLAIYEIGQAGVHMRGFSSRNVVKNSDIHDTGKYIKEYGEGIYVGSFSGKWSTESGGLPDASDDNVISNNVIGPNIGSDLVDVKEGTSGTVIENNSLDGTGQGYSKSWNDTWIIIQGNNGVLRGNRGKNAPVHGFRVTPTTAYPGLYGNNNTFENNVADVNAAGYGFKIDTGVSGNVVRCNNTVSNAASGYSNVRCSP
jgi:uncharacterized protein YjdB